MTAPDAEPPSRPRPQPTAMTAGFWDAARRRELVVQGCDTCGELRHYPQPLCPACQSPAWTWRPLNGRGVIHSFTVTHQAFHPAFAHRIPYAVATIDLVEGVRMVSDLPDDDVDRVAIGVPVEVFFDPVDEEFILPRFRIAGA